MLTIERRGRGLRVLTEQLDHLSSCAAGVWVLGGSSVEPQVHAGLSHFLEHMIFRGTPDLSGPEISRRIEGMGGSINAYTNREYLLYWIRVPSVHLRPALDILCRMVSNPALTHEHIKKEREVILAEIGEREDTPMDWVEDAHIENFLGRTGVGRAVLGEPSSLKRITRADFRSFHRKHYNPERMLVSVVGNFRPADLEPGLNRLENSDSGAADQAVSASKVAYRDGIFLESKNISQTHFCLGFPAISHTDPDQFRLTVMDTIFGGGASSRLFQEIREKRGLAYSIGSYGYAFRRGGVLNIGASVDPGDLPAAMKIVIREVRRMRDQSVPMSALNRAKEQIKGSFLIGLESTFSRMIWASKHLLFRHKQACVEEMVANVEAVTVEDVQRIARRLFNSSPLTFTAVGPFDKDSKKADLTAKLRELFQSIE